MENVKQDKQISNSYLAANLRFLRKRKKLSQEELAVEVGLNRGNIASYENGSAEPKISNLLRIAEFFGISLIDLAQRDLTEQDTLNSLTRIHGLCPQERAKLEGLFQGALDFDQFLKGIYTCYTYKSKDMEKNNQDLPQVAKFLRSHFEQLHAAALKLSEQHLQLLRMCHTKEEKKDA
ncbi:helix-turn-helix domain-containing protein [Lewinella sp. LCG006]|uniref:helix-turn-helix domain-containing protein n=1 Tax=Lewinella sp. LCG006 TaxID=3231911 RepID=UPI003460CB3A